MFNRLARLISAFFNKFLTAAEDPVTILENNIREMRDQIPKMNQGVAKAHGAVIMLQREEEELKSQEAGLRAKLKAAALSNENEIGRDIAMQLQRIINQRQKNADALLAAQNGLKTMEELRDAQIRKIKSETEKIKDAIDNSKVSKLKGELAELFETYQVGDVAYSNDEMLEKLNKEAAYNEGKLAAAAKTPDMADIRIEKKAEELQAEELYKQFAAEMNIDIAPSAKNDTKAEEKAKTSSKTIG
jgi:phage shock protein A